jgi:putative nucleotidyltransferase with HDIG domain
MTWAEWLDADAWRRPGTPAIQMPPTIASDVMPLVTNPDVSVLQLTRLIAKDQVLATRVVCLANTASLAPMQEVRAINEAIVRMGTAAVRQVVFAVCFGSKVQGDGVYGAQGRLLADHAVGTAYLARMVAEHANRDPEEAFLHGLLHDIGKLLLLKLAKDSPTLGGPEPLATEVEAECARRHAAVGASLLAEWGLPRSLCESVRHHHEPWTATEHRDEAGLIYVANKLSHRYGFGCPPSDDSAAVALLNDAECQRFQLTGAWLARADAYAPGLFQIARQIVQ